MEPVIIYYDKTAAEAEIIKVVKTVLALNTALQKFYQDTGLFILSKAEIIAFVFNHSDNAKWELNEKLKKFLDTEMDGLNITSNLMRSKFKEGNQEIINQFAAEIHKVSVFNNTDHLDKLNFAEGLVSLTEDAKEAIRDLYKQSIVNEKGMEFYELQKKTADQLQTLLDYCKKNTQLQILGHLPHFVGTLFSLDEAGSVKSILLDYGRAVKADRPELVK